MLSSGWYVTRWHVLDAMGQQVVQVDPPSDAGPEIIKFLGP